MNLTTDLNVARSAAIALVIGLGAAGCDRAPSSSSARTTEAPAADNTARNARDKSDGTVAPTDQGESESDRRITADIRKALLSMKLSTNAQNCKVITKDGVVTLRGPVASQSEKDLIAAAAQSVTGVRSVTNELEVKV